MRHRPILLLSLAAALAAPLPAAGQDTFSNVERIVAVGDVHGDVDQLVAVLRAARVIDRKNKWVGGKTHLVQTGDILDRGPDSRKVMDLLMALEPQAERAGGRVHALIGNHEAMNILGDLRYVSAGEYEAFRSSRAEELRERVYQALADSTRREDSLYRKEWEAAHPLGWVEHRLAFEGNGKYGAWLRGKNAVVRIDDYLFLHGGLSPGYAGYTVAELNAGVRRDLEPGAGPAVMAEDTLGPLWYRGLAQGAADSALTAHVDQVLARHGVRHIVIGHTVTPGAVLPRFDGKVILIDVGLGGTYGGVPAILVIEQGVPSALHRGTLVPLPIGEPRTAYLETVAALDPPDSRLRRYLERSQGVPAAVPPR